MRNNTPSNTLHSRGLTVTYAGQEQPIHALRAVDVTLRAGEITAVIGESGSGKTTLARAFLNALPASARVTHESLALPQRIAFVQQEAAASLHPLLSIGEQITDMLVVRHRTTRKRASRRTLRIEARLLLESLELKPGAEFFRRFPHQLSGGQAQRASLARALAMDAELLIADEPTSQLDLVTQAEAVKLIHRLTKEQGMYTLFITHRLPLVAEIADTVMVLHEGHVVEHGKVADVWTNPQHGYTKALLQRMARMGGEVPRGPRALDGEWPHNAGIAGRDVEHV